MLIGILALLAYPIGIPATFLLLMHHHDMPAMAREKIRDAWLLQVVEHAWQAGVPQPACELQYLTCETITDEHLEVLHAAFVPRGKRWKERTEGLSRFEKASRRVTAMRKRSRAVARTLLARLRGEVQAAFDRRPEEEETPEQRRERLLSEVLLWARTCGFLAIPPLLWGPPLSADSVNTPEKVKEQEEDDGDSDEGEDAPAAASGDDASGASRRRDKKKQGARKAAEGGKPPVGVAEGTEGSPGVQGGGSVRVSPRVGDPRGGVVEGWEGERSGSLSEHGSAGTPDDAAAGARDRHAGRISGADTSHLLPVLPDQSGSAHGLQAARAGSGSSSREAPPHHGEGPDPSASPLQRPPAKRLSRLGTLGTSQEIDGKSPRPPQLSSSFNKPPLLHSSLRGTSLAGQALRLSQRSSGVALSLNKSPTLSFRASKGGNFAGDEGTDAHHHLGSVPEGDPSAHPVKAVLPAAGAEKGGKGVLWSAESPPPPPPAAHFGGAARTQALNGSAAPGSPAGGGEGEAAEGPVPPMPAVLALRLERERKAMQEAGFLVMNYQAREKSSHARTRARTHAHCWKSISTLTLRHVPSPHFCLLRPSLAPLARRFRSSTGRSWS